MSLRRLTIDDQVLTRKYLLRFFLTFFFFVFNKLPIQFVTQFFISFIHLFIAQMTACGAPKYSTLKCLVVTRIGQYCSTGDRAWRYMFGSFSSLLFYYFRFISHLSQLLVSGSNESALKAVILDLRD